MMMREDIQARPAPYVPVYKRAKLAMVLLAPAGLKKKKAPTNSLCDFGGDRLLVKLDRRPGGEGEAAAYLSPVSVDRFLWRLMCVAFCDACQMG